jgi:endo-alpha-1,4-polygalactosaminidase (GH114 family)
VYYNRDLKKERKDLEKEKRKNKWQKALIVALRKASPGQSPNPRTYFQCGQAGHFRKYFCLPLIEEQVDLIVWTDEHTWDGHEQLPQP